MDVPESWAARCQWTRRNCRVRALAVMLFFAVAFMALSLLADSRAKAGDEPSDMKNDIMFTIVYDNYRFDKRLETAWGFSCVVQGLSETVLFDTGGNGRILLSNMAKCNISPDEIDAVVLSHIHGDHTGGLKAFLKANSNVRVFMPKTFPLPFKERVRKCGAVVVETERPCEVCEHAWTTGVLGRGIKEQGLSITTEEGLLVVTGCAHPGIVSIAEAAKEHARSDVHAVLGGFHMAGASRKEISNVIQGLRRLGVEQVGPCHCSGKETRQFMKNALGDGYLQAGVGARFTFRACAKEED